MQIGSYASLKDFAVKSSKQDQEFCDTLSSAGQKVIKNALQTFSNGNRSQKDENAAVDDLTDLERAFKAVVDRTSEETATNGARIGTDVSELNTSGIAQGKLQAGHTDPLVNTQQTEIPGWTRYGTSNYSNKEFAIAKGVRVYGNETAEAVLPETDKMPGLRAFIRDLHNVTGLYAAAVAIPGIPSVSVASFAKEEVDGSSQQTSSSSFNGSSQSAAASLLLLGARGSSSQESGGSASSSNSTVHYDKTSTDERLVPVLRDLNERLDQARLTPGKSASIVGHQGVTESRTVEQKYGLFGMRTKEVQEAMYWRHDTPQSNGTWTAAPSRVLSVEAFEPDHVTVPLNGVSNYVS